jgi:hypothetical protein
MLWPTHEYKKTKSMVFSKEKEKPPLQLNLNGNNIENVQQYIYLGQQMTDDGRCEVEIRRRIGIARSTFLTLKKLLTSRTLNISTRLRLLKCYVWSTLLYGSETWTLTGTLEKKLTAFEMWTYRRVLKIPWTDKIRNEEVLNRLGMSRTTIMNIVKKRKMQYFGHVKRHNTILKELLEGKAEGKRARGRQRTTWESNVATWTGMNLRRCSTLTSDREKWRSCVHAAADLDRDGTTNE